MQLQDFAKKHCKYDVNRISSDSELVREIQRRLFNLGVLNEGQIDGIFGPVTIAALERFQKFVGCGEPGFLGSETAKILLSLQKEDFRKILGDRDLSLSVRTTKPTTFKLKPINSSRLQGDTEKYDIPEGREFQLISYEKARGKHFRIILLRDTILKNKIWYAYAGHIELYAGNDRIHPKPKSNAVKLPVPYKSQLDNEYNPTGACNVTSLAMCLEYLKIPRKISYGQYEDELYEYALDLGLSRHDPYDLCEIVRDYGARDRFTEIATIEDVKDWLADGNPAVVHGYFTSFGHIVVLVGYDDKGFWVHDPYGEWFPGGYRTDLSGEYLHYSYDLIEDTCIPDGSFWVHFIC